MHLHKSDVDRKKSTVEVMSRLSSQFIMFLAIFFAFNFPSTNKADELDLTTNQERNNNNIVSCHKSDAKAVKCDFNKTCVYGELNTVNCQVDENVICTVSYED